MDVRERVKGGGCEKRDKTGHGAEGWGVSDNLDVQINKNICHKKIAEKLVKTHNFESLILLVLELLQFKNYQLYKLLNVI